MELSLHHLRAFESVARHRSFSRAAAELRLSQPAVSLQIKALERTIGMPLFDQIGRKIYLTPAGRELQPYAKRLLALLDETTLVLEELRGQRRGSVKISASTTAGIYVVPRLLGGFHRLYPAVGVSLEVANRFTVQERLEENQVDLAVMGLIENDQALEVAAFAPNELVVIASPRHPLAGQRNIPLEALEAETFLIREPRSGTRADTERLFAERGVTIRVGMELGSIGAIKQGVAADLGIAIMSKQAIALELQTQTLVMLDVQGFPIQRQWYVVHLKGKHLSHAARALRTYLLESQHAATGSGGAGADLPPANVS
jgi:DNA-binding transcriptional LysR family regulator